MPRTYNHKDRNISFADCTADYFLLCNDASVEFMPHLKLQKLCYLAQGWHLAKTGESLFEDEIQAWMYGPVVPYLFQRFKGYRRRPLDCAPRRSNPMEEFDDKNKDILRQVWRVYGDNTSKQLVALTHTHSPWIDAYAKREAGHVCREVITHDAMREYFLSLAEAK